jgi:hypothetical protein
VPNLICPFYNQGCIIKPTVDLPLFKVEHDCESRIDNCSFFKKQKITQTKIHSTPRIVIKQVSNVYAVKADALIVPTNNLLEIDYLLDKLTNNELSKINTNILKKGIKMGYPYQIKSKDNWKNKQKYIINAVVAGESRLVNEKDMQSAMKKSLLIADSLNFESVLMIPSDYGTHDINNTSLSQLSSIFLFSQKHKFEYLKNIFICMEDEETEQTFIEYFNRIYGEKINESRNDDNSSTGS